MEIALAKSMANAGRDADQWALVDWFRLGRHTIERWQLGRGLVAVFAIDRTAALVVYETWRPGGVGSAAGADAGLADLGFQLMRTRPEDPSFAVLERHGARVQAELHLDHSRYSVIAPTETPLEAIIAIESAPLLGPDPDRFAAAKRDARDGLGAARQRSIRFRMSEALLGSLFAADAAEAAFGAPSLARKIGLSTATPQASLDKIRRMFAEHRAIVIMTGDFDRLEALTTLARHTPTRHEPVLAAANAGGHETGAGTSIQIRIPSADDLVLVGWPLHDTTPADTVALQATTRIIAAATATTAQLIEVRTSQLRHGGTFEVLTTINPTETATGAAARIVRVVERLAIAPPPEDVVMSTARRLAIEFWRDMDAPARRAATIGRAELDAETSVGLIATANALDGLTPRRISDTVSTHLAGRTPVVVIGRADGAPQP